MIDVDVLVSTHRKSVHTQDGVEEHSAPSLISQLRDAVYGGGTRDGAGGGAKTKLPIQAAALDLYMLIDHQVTSLWVSVFHRVPGVEKLEQLLAAWAAVSDPKTVVNVGGRNIEAGDAVANWTRLIEDYFNPPRHAEIDLPCPSCGEQYSYRMVDGQERRSTALVFRRDRDTGDTLDARCLTCNAVWVPGQFMFFLTALNAAYPKGETS